MISLPKVFDKFIESLIEVFNDRRLINKFGLLYGINLILGMVSLFFSIIGASVNLWPISLSIATRQNIRMIFQSVIPILVNFLTLPLWLYKKGYTYEIANRIRADKLTILPEHENFKSTTSLGGTFLTINYSLTMPLFLTSLVPFLFLMNYKDGLNSEQDMIFLIAFLIGSAVISMLITMAFAFISNIVVPFIMYVFLKKRDLASAFDVNNFLYIFKKGFVAFVLLFVLNILLSVGFGALRLILCFLGPIAGSLIQTSRIILTGIFLGSIYYALEDVDF
jgi:hypothetical protein